MQQNGYWTMFLSVLVNSLFWSAGARKPRWLLLTGWWNIGHYGALKFCAFITVLCRFYVSISAEYNILLNLKKKKKEKKNHPWLGVTTVISTACSVWRWTSPRYLTCLTRSGNAFARWGILTNTFIWCSWLKNLLVVSLVN